MFLPIHSQIHPNFFKGVSITDNLPYRLLYKDSKTIKIDEGILTEGKKDVKAKGHLSIVCPICESTKISKRIRKKPKYKCQDCGNEFDDPKAMIVHKTLKQQIDFTRQYSNPDE